MFYKITKLAMNLQSCTMRRWNSHHGSRRSMCRKPAWRGRDLKRAAESRDEHSACEGGLKAIDESHFLDYSKQTCLRLQHFEFPTLVGADTPSGSFLPPNKLTQVGFKASALTQFWPGPQAWA